jgi:hypothetical protein
MHAVVLLVALAGSLAGQQAQMEPGAIKFGPAPSWILPAPVAEPPPTDAPAVCVVYSDGETRIGPKGTENYFDYRVKVMKPDGLAVGNVKITWNPAQGPLTVHKLSIFRNGQVIDVLKLAHFQILQREDGLDRAMLDGQLTAAIQAPGLQVGDELELSATIQTLDPTLGNRAFGMAQLPVAGQSGSFRVRLMWDGSHHVQWRSSRDLADVVSKTAGDETEVMYEMRDPKPAITIDGAPRRLNFRRLIEYSDYRTWAELSAQVSALFDAASTLEDDSPVHQEARKIAAQTSDSAARALAALKVVEDQIRYVYVGLNGGNYRPATADETWKRRFGDCKAKTALLLSMLRELGVPAEAALVNAENGDGIAERLPNPAVFDHVLVRATIEGKSYWLDGTRVGDSALATLPPPMFRWALPLRANGAELLAVPLEPPSDPEFLQVLNVDATAGFDHLANVKLQNILRGGQASELRLRLSALSPEEANRQLTAVWRQGSPWLQPSAVSWRYDEDRAALVLSVTGEGRIDWEGTDADGRALSIPGAGFYPPDQLKRPKDQDQTAPWMTDFPRFRCFATSIRLPVDAKWKWTYSANPMDRNLGGHAYWRTADLRGNIMRTVMSKRAYLPEISADQAAELNAAIPDFDNKMSRVYQVPSKDTGSGGSDAVAGPQKPPFDDATNWLESSAICRSPKSGSN